MVNVYEVNLHDSESTIEVLKLIIEEFPEKKSSCQHQFKIAFLYDYMGKKKEAAKAYYLFIQKYKEQYLEEFPDLFAKAEEKLEELCAEVVCEWLEAA